MGILLTIFCVILLFKLTGLFFRVCGKILGVIFSLIGYALIGMLMVTAFGIALRALPFLLLVGIGATAIAAAKS